MRTKQITTPGGTSYGLFADMLKQPHLLIAGATGSGKSVVINGLIHEALIQSFPSEAGLMLVDPKRVELNIYRNIPHCIAYSSEPSEHSELLNRALRIIDQRYQQLAAEGKRKWEGGQIYVIIDELADLMLTDKKTVQPLLQRIAQIGRAAGVHLIAATQCPLVQVIPTPIKCNFDSRVALRTRSASDSRNIIGETGCEKLPRFGKCYYMTPEGLEKHDVPYVDDSEIERVVQHWIAQT